MNEYRCKHTVDIEQLIEEMKMNDANASEIMRAYDQEERKFHEDYPDAEFSPAVCEYITKADAERIHARWAFSDGRFGDVEGHICKAGIYMIEARALHESGS